MPDRVHAAYVQTDYRETVMIVDYNRSPNITEEERLASLQDSVQRALDELMQMISGIETPEKNGLVEKVEVVTQKAGSAKQRAVFSQQLAEKAQTMADEAGKAAQTAWEYADDAKDAADAAQGSANTANRAANAALDQLGVVQDVVGVLDWASSHGTFELTSDVTVQEGKVYFVYDSGTGDYSPVVDPKDEELSTYYELSMTEAMQTFIMAHLAVTQRGLWVLPSGVGSGTTPAQGETQADSDARQGSNYKALLSNSGLLIYDGNGQLVSTFGESIVFSSSRQQVIGGQSNYILFDPTDGSILINGSDVRIGDTGKKLDEVLTDVDISTQQTATGAEITIAGQTVELLNGQDGQQGAPGYTPYIQSGYWYINGTSTGVKAQGEDGTTTLWYYGDTITGTSTTPTVFVDSDVTNAVVGDIYLNTDTAYVYQCTLGGAASVAEWVYAGSIADGVMDNLDVYTRDEIDEINLTTAETIITVNDNIAELAESVSAQADEVDTMKVDIVESASNISNIGTVVDTYLGADGYININNGTLELGRGTFKAVITPTELGFFDGNQKVAYISNEELVISRTKVSREMRMGNFVWTIKPDGKLILKHSEEQVQ